MRLIFLALTLISIQFVFAQQPGEGYIIQIRPDYKDAVIETLYNSEEINYKPLVEDLGIYQIWGGSASELVMIQTLSPLLISDQKNAKIEYRAKPNDPLYDQQWHLFSDGSLGGVAGADINAEEAWEITTGGVNNAGDTIVLCIIDDGIQEDHPDVIDNLWINHDEIPGDGVDNDENGYVDDYRGWNSYTGNDDINDGNFGGNHGTRVFGMAAAKGNNGIGVSGLNWDVKVMQVVGGTDEAAAIVAYNYPLKMRQMWNQSNGKEGAYVVATNASWGQDQKTPDDAPIWCNLYELLGAEGIINAAATANRDYDVDIEGDLPTTCTSEYMVGVTSTTKSDLKAGTAAYGPISIDIGAPGANVYTTFQSVGQYSTTNGTSFASPLVAGSFALLHSVPNNPFGMMDRIEKSWAPIWCKRFLIDNVDTIPDLMGRTVSGGRLNLGNAVKAVQAYKDVVKCEGSFNARISREQNTITIQWDSIEGIDYHAEWIIDTLEPQFETFLNTSEFEVGDLPPCTPVEITLWRSCGDTLEFNVLSTSLVTTGCKGIESISPQAEVYPNPTRGNLTIQSSMPIESVHVLDLSGRTIYSELCSGFRFSEEIDLNTLISGVYVVQIRTREGRIENKKIRVAR